MLRDKEFLLWIYDRLVTIYGVNPNMDYMATFKQIIEAVDIYTPSKPPVGLVPRHIQDGIRLIEITTAVNNFALAGEKIPMLWIDELLEIIDRRKSNEKCETVSSSTSCGSESR
jgi:hypothetical protein